MMDGSGFNHPNNQNHLWWSSVCVPRLAGLAHLHVCWFVFEQQCVFVQARFPIFD